MRAVCRWWREALVTLALPAAVGAAPLFGPYKDVSLPPQPPQASQPPRQAAQGNLHPGAPPHPLALAGLSPLPAGAQVLALAFASGECGQEHWGALSGQQVADRQVAALQRLRIPYIVSTGGEGGVFTCDSAEGFQAFLARYDSPWLRGLDFDIEASQSEAQVNALVLSIARATATRPNLRLSFTLATLAASDGSGAGLNASGQRVMQALRDAGLEGRAVVNLMVMNYGPASPAHCVVRAGRCDMVASARQAVDNLHARHGVPYARIAVTAMLGVNDVTENVFTPQDAYRLARYARSRGLAGLHYWSLDRDKPCDGGATAVAPSCSSLNQVREQGFAQAFARGLR